MEITLKELLDSREQRVWHQNELLENNGGVLVCVTLNIPGPIKDKPQYRELMKWGMDKLLLALGQKVTYHETLFLKTGAEGYVCLNNIDALEVKKITVDLENLSQKARLLDIDVLTKDGGIGRSQLGIEPRKCLLCDDNAKACARSQNHSMEELLAKVEELCYDEDSL